MEEFVRMFKSQILVLNVVKLGEAPGYEKAAALVKMKKVLGRTKHNFFFPVSENVTDEINSFIHRHKADMLVMLPHKHNTFEKLFRRSSTKRMAFHTSVPLLSIH